MTMKVYLVDNSLTTFLC